MARIFSVGDLKKKDEEEKQQEFYAGGTDNRGGGSGLAVVGPPRGGPANVFDGVVAKAQSEAAASTGDNVKTVKLNMYRNGFTVDEGPLRDPAAPENEEFMQNLNRGMIPRELREAGKEIDVVLTDKREEDYVPPAYVAFSGGATLGASSSSSERVIFTDSMLTGLGAVVVDDSKPTTTLQIKTQSGQKLRVKINQDQTVLHLAGHIRSVVGAGGSFTLNAGFPPKDLANASLTIAEAGLVGASISHKLVQQVDFVNDGTTVHGWCQNLPIQKKYGLHYSDHGSQLQNTDCSLHPPKDRTMMDVMGQDQGQGVLSQINKSGLDMTAHVILRHGVQQMASI